MSIDSINQKVKKYREKRKEWERQQSWYGKTVNDLVDDLMSHFNQLEVLDYSIRLPKNIHGLDRLDIYQSKKVKLFTIVDVCILQNARIEWLQYLHSHIDEIIKLIEDDVDDKIEEEFEV